MSAVVALTGAVLVTWLLRVLFVAVLPADRLPARVRRHLRHVGPAVLAALVVTLLVGHDGPTGLLIPSWRHLALAVAALVAWRVRHAAAPMLAALTVMVVVDTLT